MQDEVAARCFEEAERLSISSHRSSEQNEAMLKLAMSSVQHATQSSVGDRRLLVASCWLASTINGQLGLPEAALRLANTCVTYSLGLPLDYQGYAAAALYRAKEALGLHRQAADARARALQIAWHLSPDGKGALHEELNAIA